MQNPRTMDNPAPSCILVKILATAPAVLMPDVIKLNCPVPLACSIKSSKVVRITRCILLNKQTEVSSG